MFCRAVRFFKREPEIVVTPYKMDQAMKVQCPDIWHTVGADFMWHMIMNMYIYDGKDWSYAYGEM